MNLRIEHLTKSFDGRCVLDAISADFGESRALVLIGPSGGGKSTLLRIIAGLEVPDRGKVTLNGESVDFSNEAALRRHRLKLGVVFQAFNLFPHLTALENVVLALEKGHGRQRDEAREIAQATLARFQLATHAHKKPAELSGGQKQRVAIARAIAIESRVLLFDEPTSALDPEMTAEVLELIEELKTDGRDLILITHAMGFARRVGDVAAFLAEGRLVEFGPAQRLFAEPSTPVCRKFLERVLRY